ncbi:uncharacterized protein LOC118421463 [Branchiostoma floridae]|uniref:Uncharacterized protein LOC118421463 n=1 Tax=Branchiostoma floridae TaxID=7739 RepID=A0A9J7LKM1_BRAFL|nr:uncharacterized protein LOC118421463 [Branchiostoma floridae]
MEKIREAVKKKLSRPKGGRSGMGHHLGNINQNQHLHFDKTSQYQGHLKKADSSLARADLDSAEQHFAAALKAVHERDPTAQQYQREVEPLCKLGDVYSKRGQQTGDGGDFVKAAALYNAAIARSNNEVLNGNIVTAIVDVEKSFLKCILDISHNVSLLNKENHKKQLKKMRDQIKLEMETIDHQLDPYVHDEDDPRVRVIEAKRAQAVRKLFEKISQQRKEFISLLVEECIGLMGPPPCKYALIGLGSQATGLVTPYSDLEFAILIDEESEQYKLYFRNLTHFLHLKVVNLGETILPALGIKSFNDFYSKNPLDSWYYDSVTPRGFAFDGSMPKASKTPLGQQGTKTKPPRELICTPNNMVSILQNDVTLYLKEGYHLATILRNPCLIAGDQDLIDMYMGITVEILQANGGKMAQQLAQETLRENIKSYDRNETVTAKLIDVKKKIYRFPAVAVDCLALSSGIIPTTVWETIEEMENQQVISPNNAHHLTVLTSISAELRLRTYIANGGQKENLSALTSMETTQHIRQESSKQTNDEEQTIALKAAFHVPNQKQLFRYYHTAVPLKNVLSKFIGDKPTLGQLSDFYDASSRVQGDMYHELCKYRLAISYFEEAIHAVKNDPEKMQLLRKLGVAWDKSGDYQKAISYHEQALQMYRSIFGQATAHSEIAVILNNLGSALIGLGKHHEALSYLEQALQMSRSIYNQSTDHPNIDDVLNNIGHVWFCLGDYRRSIRYHELILQNLMKRSIHGQTSHTSIAILLNNLGTAWQRIGENSKAINYFERALQMYWSIYGRSTAHPYIAASINNLGKTLVDVGDHKKAISYYEQALQIYRTIYMCGESAGHPSIVISLTNIGSAWDRLGEYKKAISYHEQALQMSRSIYGQGTEHSNIARSLNNIGTAWHGLGDYIKAISYHEEALKMYRGIHGQNTVHPDIAMSLNNLGFARNLHDFKKSGNNLSFRKLNGITDIEQALQMYKSIYGQNMAHPDIATSLNNLGIAWQNSRDHAKAVHFYEQALQMKRRIFGQFTPHADTAVSLHNLGNALCDLGDHRKGITYCEQALQMRRSIYGENAAHLEIATSLKVLGGNYADFGDHRKAISYLEHSVQMRRKIYGENTAHPDIATSLNNLAHAFQCVGNHQKANSFYEQALQMFKRIYGQSTAHADIASTLTNMASTWNLLGYHSKAIRVCQEALAMARQVYPQDKSHPLIKVIERNIAVIEKKNQQMYK